MKTLYINLLFLLVCSSAKAQTTPIKLPWNPEAITLDADDNLLIEFEDMIMKITPDLKASYVTENMGKDFRGSVRPYCDMMTTALNGDVFIARNFDNEIWKMSPEGKFSIYIADEKRQSAWASPATHIMDPGSVEFMAVDKSGNLYYAESLPNNERINKLNTSAFHIISPRGDKFTYKNNNGEPVKLNQVDGIGIDSAGNLYVSNVKERCIKKISRSGDITVVAGQCGKRDVCPVYSQGDISKAELVQPGPIIFNKKGELFFADIRMNRIIKVANNKVTTAAGASPIQPCGSNIAGRSKEGYKDGKALTALFNFPAGVQLAIDSKDNIYILDEGNGAVRKLSPQGQVSTIAKRQ